MTLIQKISILFILNVCKGEITLSTCSAERPFLLNNVTCGNYEDICLKKEDNNCNILRKSCQQCPPTNYTVLMLKDIMQTTKNSTKILMNYINEKTIFLKDEINNNEKKIGDIEDKLIKMRNISNDLKNEINNNEKKIGNIKDKLLNMKEKIENNTNYLKMELDTFRNFLANETNLIKVFVSNEINLMKTFWLDAIKKNETAESPRKIEQLSNHVLLIWNYIILITIFLFIIMILLILLLLKIFNLPPWKMNPQPIPENSHENLPDNRNMNKNRLLNEESVDKANIPLKSKPSHYDSKMKYFATSQQI